MAIIGGGIIYGRRCVKLVILTQRRLFYSYLFIAASPGFFRGKNLSDMPDHFGRVASYDR